MQKGLPAERATGVIQFIKSGGQIFLCEDDWGIQSAFWIIALTDLSAIQPIQLPRESPLRTIVESDLKSRLGQAGFLVFSWTPKSSRGIWLFRFLRRLGVRSHYGSRIIGFVATGDQAAIQNYLRIGCSIVTRLPCTYSTNDSHYLLEYFPGLSRRISRAAAALMPIPTCSGHDDMPKGDFSAGADRMCHSLAVAGESGK